MNQTFKRTLSVLAASAGAIAIATVGASSTIAAAPDVFSVTSLTTDSPIYTDAEELAGDDDGFLGVTGTKFLFSGDTATIAYDLSDLGNPYVTDVDNGEAQNNWIFSDLKTQTSYLYVAEQTDDDEYDITGIQPLDGTGDVSGAVITLSETLTINNDEDDCTIFASGYGRSAIWDGCLGVIYDIELPSGIVTTVDAATFADYEDTMPLLLDWYEVDNGVSQSTIVEYDGSALHVLAVARTAADYPVGIFRYDVQNVASTPTLLISFGDDPDGPDYVDLYKFTASPATNQWCAGSESGWDAITEDPIDELAFCASATFAIGAVPVPEPALAATGLDMTSTIAAGALVLLAGAGLVLLARRRTASN